MSWANFHFLGQHNTFLAQELREQDPAAERAAAALQEVRGLRGPGRLRTILALVDSFTGNRSFAISRALEWS